MYEFWSNLGYMVLVPGLFAAFLAFIVPAEREKRARREREAEELRREYEAALDARERLREIAARATGLPMARTDPATGRPYRYGALNPPDEHFMPGHCCVRGYCPHFPQKRPPAVIEPCARHREIEAEPRRLIMRVFFPKGVPDEAGYAARGLFVRHRSGV